MNASQILKGQIIVENKSSKKPLSLSFEFKKCKCSLQDTLINCFDNLNLHQKEIKDLTFEHRQLINLYQKLDHEEVKKYSEKLISYINNEGKNNSKIHINATEIGSFICLAAIYSGRLNPKVQIEFNLASAPIKLFPEKLMNKNIKNNNIKIQFDLEQSTWLSKLTTLTYNPHFSDIKFNYQAEKRKIG